MNRNRKLYIKKRDLSWSFYVGTFPGPARQVVFAPCTFRWWPAKWSSSKCQSFATSFCGILGKMTWYRAFLLKESETGSSLNALHRSPDHSSIRIRHVLMFSFGIIVRVLYLNLQRLFGPLHSPSSLFMTLMISMLIMNDSSSLSFSASFSPVGSPHLKEETDLASLPVEPGSIEVGASIWPFWFWWECWAWFVCEPAPWRLMPIKSASEKRIDRAERLDPVEDLEAPWPARPSLPRRGLSTRQLLILPACSNSSCSRPISEQLKWKVVSSTEHQLACCLLSAHWGAADAAQSRCQHRPHKDLKPLPSNAPLLLPSPNIGNIRHIGCGCTYQYSVRANQPTLWVIFSKIFFSISSPIPLSFLLIIFQIQKVSRRWPGWRLNPTDQLYTTSFAQRLKLCSGAFSSTAWNWKHWICFIVYSWLGISRWV